MELGLASMEPAQLLVTPEVVNVADRRLVCSVVNNGEIVVHKLDSKFPSHAEK
jgi:hypothetical protein